MKGNPRYSPVVLKFELLSQGLRVGPETAEALGKELKEDVGIGATGKHALDLILNPGKVYVGVPVGRTISRHLVGGTPFSLEKIDGEYVVTKKPARLGPDNKWICLDEDAPGEPVMSVTVPPRPGYYDLSTSRGLPMRNVMPIAADFGGATIFPNCHYFGRFREEYVGQECRYCSIDENLKSGRDLRGKKPIDFVETVAEARKYTFFRHGPVFAGGTSPPPDRGARVHARYIREIREAFSDNWIRLTLAPPEEEQDVDLVFEAGADLLGYNYEIYDPVLFDRLCPGKVKDIERGVPGHAHYDRMLQYIVKTFGKNRASANLLLGLEPVESTVAGIAHLAGMGVIPTVFVFVPHLGTALEAQPTPSAVDMVYVYQKLREIVEEQYGLDTQCAGCHRMMVNTKIYDGLHHRMPEITESHLRTAGLPPESLAEPPRTPFVLNLKW